ncbi:uncharacterized protein KY384_007997 [Bacidia gigantensis]|uniref:uncharacterized protein n=1 Tax=Bacidia gigantensis TaxID=2732470 RepID=UPI001D03C847|nr:uncharacterized protein KY384_007997 [Bacidia gigantensis]KAG8527253.1 hypothetical protein KY384_007997 [Bacidia gigantensis]
MHTQTRRLPSQLIFPLPKLSQTAIRKSTVKQHSEVPDSDQLAVVDLSTVQRGAMSDIASLVAYSANPTEGAYARRRQLPGGASEWVPSASTCEKTREEDTEHILTWHVVFGLLAILILYALAMLSYPVLKPAIGFVSLKEWTPHRENGGLRQHTGSGLDIENSFASCSLKDESALMLTRQASYNKSMFALNRQFTSVLACQVKYYHFGTPQETLKVIRDTKLYIDQAERRGKLLLSKLERLRQKCKEHHSQVLSEVDSEACGEKYVHKVLRIPKSRRQDESTKAALARLDYQLHLRASEEAVLNATYDAEQEIRVLGHDIEMMSQLKGDIQHWASQVQQWVYDLGETSMGLGFAEASLSITKGTKSQHQKLKKMFFNAMVACQMFDVDTSEAFWNELECVPLLGPGDT